MKAKRILSTLLAALLLAGSLTACATGNEDDPQQTTSSEETETNLDDLPAGLNYNGTEIIILSRGRLG
jgi:PBP1b-binding outer membrane lipoprotein LpoB